MFSQITPVVFNLMVINVIVFLGMMVLPEYTYYFKLVKNDWVLNRPYDGDLSLPLQVVTHFFNHSGFLHIGFNMLALSSMGSPVEHVLGSRRFLELYLFSGIIGGLLTATFDPSDVPVVGASGAICGVLVAYAYLFPESKLSILFIPWGIAARTFVLVFAGISVALIVFPFDRIGISHFGHLAGMVGALIYFGIQRFMK